MKRQSRPRQMEGGWSKDTAVSGRQAGKFGEVTETCYVNSLVNHISQLSAFRRSIEHQS